MKRLWLVWCLFAWPTEVSAQLPHNIPDFCASSSAGVPVGQTQTWTGSQVMDCVAVRGTLILQGALSANTIMVYEGGFLDVPCGASITFRDTPLDTTLDPEQFGQGLLVFGRLRMLCATKTPFVRLSTEPLAGQSLLTLASAPTGWVVGDTVFLPDTRQVPSDFWFNPAFGYQHETRTIAAISGAAITLNTPMTFDHRGARDADGTETLLTDGTRLLPHLANLTRSITVQSANPAGTRGHLLATGRADVLIAGVAFQDLGRTKAEGLSSFPANPATNQIGRYPVHMHHLMGPVNPTNTGYQFTLVGNVVRDSLKWPIAIHRSSYGRIEDNVIIGGSQMTGAGLAFEEATETENLARGNFIADIRGNVNPRNSGPDTANGTTPGSAGECIWSAGWHNRLVDNVVTGCRNVAQQIASGVGIKLIVGAAPYTTYLPAFRGGDIDDPAQRVSVVPQRLPILQLDGQECYGLMATCLTTWHLGTDGGSYAATQPESLVRNMRVWHSYDGVWWGYPTNRITFENPVFRMAVVPGWLPPAFRSGDYRTGHLTIRGGSIHAEYVWADVKDPVGTIRLENIVAVTRQYAFNFQTPATPGTGMPRPPEGVTFALSGNVVSAWPGQPLRTINFSHSPAAPASFTAPPYVVNVTAHQGLAGDDFRACFSEQATQDLYGGICTGTTRPDIVGIVSGTAVPPPPPPPPPDPCVETPLIVSVTSWPNPNAGSRQLRYTSSQRLVSFTLDLALTRATFTDSRGCVAVRVK